MITLIYLVILINSVLVISLIDVLIYKHSFIWVLIMMMKVQAGTAQWMVFFMLVIGFFYSIGSDYRIWKQRKSS